MTKYLQEHDVSRFDQIRIVSMFLIEGLKDVIPIMLNDFRTSEKRDRLNAQIDESRKGRIGLKLHGFLYKHGYVDLDEELQMLK